MNKHNWVYRNAINTLLDHDFNNTGTYLCCRKLVWKFIRFFWNPLPLLQTPENLENQKKECDIIDFSLKLRHWSNPLITWDVLEPDRQTDRRSGGGNYKPIRRRRSSNHERCPKECWVCAGDPKTPHELCFHTLVQRLKNHPALSQPEPQFVVSYKKKKTIRTIVLNVTTT